MSFLKETEETEESGQATSSTLQSHHLCLYHHGSCSTCHPYRLSLFPFLFLFLCCFHSCHQCLPIDVRHSRTVCYLHWIFVLYRRLFSEVVLYLLGVLQVKIVLLLTRQLACDPEGRNLSFPVILLVFWNYCVWQCSVVKHHSRLVVQQRGLLSEQRVCNIDRLGEIQCRLVRDYRSRIHDGDFFYHGV